MGKLTNEQRNKLRDFLQGQGLTFKPLLEEMVDHVICDLEDRMLQGSSFHEAWDQSMKEIPKDHFQIIQKQTMETINKRFTLSQGLSYLSLALLFLSVALKVMHMPGSPQLLLVAFFSIAASLLTSSLTGIYLNKEKKGSVRVLAVVAGVIILLVGYSFKILHFPGADELLLLAVMVILTALLVNTLYVYQNASGEGNLLTYLHEKYTPGIERFLLFLLLPVMIYKMIAMAVRPADFVGNVILLIVIFGTALQFIALNWRIMEKNLSKRNSLLLTATIISFLCFTLPFLGEAFLPFKMRVVMISLFSIVSGWLAYQMEDEPKKITSLIMAFLVPVLFFGWGLILLGVIPSSANRIIFNLPILLILITGLFLCRKHGTMRTYMMISLSSYLFEYRVVLN